MLSCGLSMVGAAIARVPYLFACSSHLTPRHQSEEATCGTLAGRHYGDRCPGWARHLRQPWPSRRLTIFLSDRARSLFHKRVRNQPNRDAIIQGAPQITVLAVTPILYKPRLWTGGQPRIVSHNPFHSSERRR